MSNQEFIKNEKPTLQTTEADPLYESRQQLQLIYDTAQDCLFLIEVKDESEFFFISMNNSGLKAIGANLDQIVNKNIKDVIPQPSLNLVLEKYHEAISTKKTVQWQEVTEYPTGVKTAIVSVSPIFNNEGKCTRLVGAVHDVTENKNAENLLRENEALFTTFFESNIDGILLTITDGDIIAANPTACAMFKMTEDEICKAGRFGIVDINDPRLHILIEERRLNGRVKGEVTFKRKDGSFFPGEISSVMYEHANGSKRTSMIIRDLSEKKKEEESNRFKAQLLNTIGQAVLATDINGIINFWNKAAEKIYGWTEGEAIGKNVVELIPSEQTKEQALEIMYQLTHGESWSGEFLVKRKDGHVFPVYVNDSPVYDNDNNLCGIIGVSTDITERKKAQEELRLSNERYDMVALATNDCMWDWNLETNEVLRPGKKLEQLLGYPEIAPEDVDEFWRLHTHAEDWERMTDERQYLFNSNNDNHWHDTYRFIKPDGNYAYVYDRGYILRDENGKAIRMVGASRDISKEKDNEMELKALNTQLQIWSQKLASSNAELEQFAYVASHDLQEPLRTITSFLTQLNKKYGDSLDEKGKKYLEFTVDGANRMRKIINDLLEFSKVNKKEASQEEINLNDMVEGIKLLFQQQIEEKNAIVYADNLPVIKTSQAQLMQVLQNLIGNALKYTTENIQPEIFISVADAVTRWQFSVKDNGIGIDPEYFDKIFVIFQRLHTKNEYSGTGIGLAITKKIIESLHQKIWVQSAEGKGSTFYFTWPK